MLLHYHSYDEISFTASIKHWLKPSWSRSLWSIVFHIRKNRDMWLPWKKCIILHCPDSRNVNRNTIQKCSPWQIKDSTAEGSFWKMKWTSADGKISSKFIHQNPICFLDFFLLHWLLKISAWKLKDWNMPLSIYFTFASEDNDYLGLDF